MKNICDYMIIQRDPDGFGRAVFSGEYNDNFVDIVACVIREDDNSFVVPWQKCKTSGNKWSIELVIPQGGLYRVEARRTLVEFNPVLSRCDWDFPVAMARHVGVGDIFILAGQSNLAAYGRDAAFDPPQLGVHLFDNSANWVLASHPLNFALNPVYCNNDNGCTTSPGLSFGKKMSLRLGVPIGLVTALLGGSSLDMWDPVEDDCKLYHSMKKKIEAVGKFAGIIWYQGCSDCNEDEAPTYFDRFNRTVKAWRKEFGHFPMIVCQINRHASKTDDNDRMWGLVREALRQSAKKIDDVYVIPTHDMPTSDGIHNTSGSCIIIGERIADTLLHAKYGFPGNFAPSVNKAKKLDERNILVTFDEEQQLRTMDDLACGLNIEDSEGMMNCTKVVRTPEGLVVTTPRDIAENGKFHAYWKKEQPSFFIRNPFGMPMLSCYNVEIE